MKKPIPTGVEALDRILAGGFGPFPVLLSGDHYCGKTTMLLQVASNVSQSGLNVSYFSANSTKKALRRIAARMGVPCDKVQIYDDIIDKGSIVDLWSKERPDFVIVDDVDSMPRGSLRSLCSVSHDLELPFLISSVECRRDERGPPIRSVFTLYAALELTRTPKRTGELRVVGKNRLGDSDMKLQIHLTKQGFKS